MKIYYFVRILDSDQYYDGTNMANQFISSTHFSEVCNAVKFEERFVIEDMIKEGMFNNVDDYIEIVEVYG